MTGFDEKFDEKCRAGFNLLHQSDAKRKLQWQMKSYEIQRTLKRRNAFKPIISLLGCLGVDCHLGKNARRRTVIIEGLIFTSVPNPIFCSRPTNRLVADFKLTDMFNFTEQFSVIV